jgi:hypothetical protein
MRTIFAASSAPWNVLLDQVESRFPLSAPVAAALRDNQHRVARRCRSARTANAMLRRLHHRTEQLLREVTVADTADTEDSVFGRDRYDCNDWLQKVVAEFTHQQIALLARRVRQPPDLFEVFTDAAFNVSDIVHVTTPAPEFRAQRILIPEAL